MKKILLSCLFAVITLCSFGQEHLSFKGIPIEGSMKSFCDKLKEKGLHFIAEQNNISLYTGDFTGKPATIGAVANDKGTDVYAVLVLFDESEEWKTLVNTYDYYKGLYTEKYGKPSFNKENNPSRGDSNISLMSELYQGKVVYCSEFNAPGGTIEISIEKSAGIGYKGVVTIKYRDSQNIQTKRQNDLDEI